MPKIVNPNLAKIHHSYYVGEVAILFSVHKNTVRSWVKTGLPVCDDKRPTLILGRELREFLTQRRMKAKRPCSPFEMYCFKCRAPKIPAGEIAEYIPISDLRGRLIGICPACETMMNRFTGIAKLPQIRRKLEVVIKEPENT